MHPLDCPSWEYAHHPNKDQVLLDRASGLAEALRRRFIDSGALAADTRRAHHKLFELLTPPGFTYYAGHYRGENYRCLLYLAVGIPGDPRVGSLPHRVLGDMSAVAFEVKAGLAALDTAQNLPNGQLPAEDKLLYAVVFACHVFEIFLRVHPYANGNGHAARLIVWAILGRYGYWPHNWPIEPRPTDPVYTSLLVDYRNGIKEPLEQFMVRCIIG